VRLILVGIMPRAKAMEIIGTFVFFIGLLFSLIAYSTNAWIKVDMPGSGKENPVYEAAYPNFAELTVGFSGQQQPHFPLIFAPSKFRSAPRILHHW